jgi:hypothetical protein
MACDRVLGQKIMLMPAAVYAKLGIVISLNVDHMNINRRIREN